MRIGIVTVMIDGPVLRNNELDLSLRLRADSVEGMKSLFISACADGNQMMDKLWIEWTAIIWRSVSDMFWTWINPRIFAESNSIRFSEIKMMGYRNAWGYRGVGKLRG